MDDAELIRRVAARGFLEPSALREVQAKAKARGVPLRLVLGRMLTPEQVRAVAEDSGSLVEEGVTRADTREPPVPEALQQTAAPGGGSPPTSADQLPRRLGVYELTKILGKGGMGIVYRARHTQLDRECAIKVLIAGQDASEELLARFVSEARTAAKLDSHPHVVSVIDANRVGNCSYMAMEFVEGTNLRDLIERDKIGPKNLARVLSEIASALAHAHANGIVHRDVKPDNILIDRAGRARLTDFGVAKAGGGELTQTGAVIGTLGYMSPEQANDSSRADSRSDVYGLGAVLYAFLTGRAPHVGASAVNVLSSLLSKDPPRPTELNPECDPALEAICLAALHKNPDERTPSAEVFRVALDDYRAGVGGDDPEQANSHLPLLSAVAVLLLVLLGAGVGLTLSSTKPQPAPDVTVGSAPTSETNPIGEPEPAKPDSEPEKPAEPEPAKPEPAQPAKPEPAQLETPEPAEPAKSEPAKSEPVKPEPVKPKPAKPEPAKPKPAEPEPDEPTEPEPGVADIRPPEHPIPQVLWTQLPSVLEAKGSKRLRLSGRIHPAGSALKVRLGTQELKLTDETRFNARVRASTLRRGVRLVVEDSAGVEHDHDLELGMLLDDLYLWRVASPSTQRLEIKHVARKLAKLGLEPLGLEPYACNGASFRIAAFQHSSTGIRFHLLPGGSFTFGLRNLEAELAYWKKRGEISRHDLPHEIPARDVRLRPFLMARYPTLKPEWDTVESGQRSTRRHTYPAPSSTLKKIQAWLKKAPRAFRLPSEAEWEYACRAGSTTRFYWGDDPDPRYVWSKANSPGTLQPSALHLDRANAFGLVDMCGNASEIVADQWNPNHEGAHPDGRARSGDPGFSVIKGGSYYSSKNLCFRPTWRARQPVDSGSRGNTFRLAVSLPE